MPRFLRCCCLIFIAAAFLMVGQMQVGAEQPVIGNMAANSELVYLDAPPKGLTPAKGDGSDETRIIQRIFDYAASNHKTIVIPENKTFVVDQILVYKKNNFSIQGFGTFKHKAGATKSLLLISQCRNFTIETLHTDGNGDYNKGHYQTQNLHSTAIINCSNFVIKNLVDKDPAADSLYLNGVANAWIGTVTATSDKPRGRNGLGIIKAQNLTIESVNIQNIGTIDQPGGIDLEPNYATDTIENVEILFAKVRAAYGDGIAITNLPGARVRNIEINGEVTKYGDVGGYILKLNNVENFRGNIKIYQEGTPYCTGARISGCSNIEANLEIYNTLNGIDLGKNSSNITLTGKIIGTEKDGISIWEGLRDSLIDMEIKEVGRSGKHGAIQISEYGSMHNVIFKGDYSYSGSGKYCFLVDGVVTNSWAENLIRNGWHRHNLLTGVNARSLGILSS